MSSLILYALAALTLPPSGSVLVPPAARGAGMEVEAGAGTQEGAAAPSEEPLAAGPLLVQLLEGDRPGRVQMAERLADILPTSQVLEALPLLADRDPEIRVIAAGLLARPDLAGAARRERVGALARAAALDADRRVVMAAIESLGRIGGPRATAELAALTGDDMNAVAVAAARALAGAPGGLSPLCALVRRSTASEGRPRSAVLVELLPPLRPVARRRAGGHRGRSRAPRLWTSAPILRRPGRGPGGLRPTDLSAHRLGGPGPGLLAAREARRRGD